MEKVLIMGFPSKKCLGNLHFLSCIGMEKVLIMGFPTKKSFGNLPFMSLNITFQFVHHGVVLLLPMHKASETSVTYEEDDELVLHNGFYV